MCDKGRQQRDGRQKFALRIIRLSAKFALSFANVSSMLFSTLLASTVALQ
jgi:hypothetical protein